MRQVSRMKINRAPKIILDSKLDTKIRICRLNTKSFPDVMHYLTKTGVINLRQKAEDRTE